MPIILRCKNAKRDMERVEEHQAYCHDPECPARPGRMVELNASAERYATLSETEPGLLVRPELPLLPEK